MAALCRKVGLRETPGLTVHQGHARFESPRYIVSDNSGTLYISETNGNTIRALNAMRMAQGRGLARAAE